MDVVDWILYMQVKTNPDLTSSSTVIICACMEAPYDVEDDNVTLSNCKEHMVSTSYIMIAKY
jgi:hypothetical protein